MRDLLNKYRPKRFEEVVGQDVVVRSLQTAIKNKTGKSFLFIGPSGTGKTTLARIAASELGCLPQNLQEVDAASYTGIDDMRAITSEMVYKPLGKGSIKAILVDEVQALSKSAFQSLLKSLEEPPPWVYWFLCTTEPSKVPAAVKTRCLSYELKPVHPNELDKLYDLVVEAEDLHIKNEVADIIINEANGSPRQLLANLGVCIEAKNVKEAAELLRSAQESPAAIDLARAIFKGANWAELQRILSTMTDINAESARHVVRSYGTKVVLSSTKENVAGRILEILDAFSEPFNSSDGITPLVLACGRITLLSPA